jgi:dTDP-4-dehydrorhamnose 3,5-epimerase
LDPDLHIAWPADAPQLSVRDAAAPSLADALATGLLPTYKTCVDFAASLDAAG